jgi:hypothetical protein
MFTLGSQRQGHQSRPASHELVIALGGRAEAHHRAPERNRKSCSITAAIPG